MQPFMINHGRLDYENAPSKAAQSLQRRSHNTLTTITPALPSYLKRSTSSLLLPLHFITMPTLKFLLAVLSFSVLATSLPVHTNGSRRLALRNADLEERSTAFGLKYPKTSWLAPLTTLTPTLKLGNMRTSAGGVTIRKWIDTQHTEGQSFTCPACKSPTTTLITTVKKKDSMSSARKTMPKKAKGKRDLEDVESKSEFEMRDFAN
ncbi:hypothetical protein DACRYDRAFT_110707 [Dacryopinax primogenitus]|uniref:Uncharacterized protein n=1 Tax=Dacryopinax primogenitus (strain DJM 731) TaxID=1858805 RepID=M5FSG9_DACPD|nr:uncharacterized protein DACRYDRAFT_110707 [Dacryopinax primogenitus]EJT98818.1 hypothetical protein DACRYDRAFT_110707 [Dacryopinax primogenitus]